MYRQLNTAVVSIFFALGAALLPSAASADQPASNGAAIEAITQQLDRYKNALNASNTDEVMKLYEADAIVMPPDHPTVIGKDDIRQTYDTVSKAIKLNVTFKIDEIKRLSSDWAFARTQSHGTLTTLDNNAQMPESNQEIFIFHRAKDGTWLIARYIFSATQPAKDGK